jgi:hypothetical protein
MRVSFEFLCRARLAHVLSVSLQALGMKSVILAMAVLPNSGHAQLSGLNVTQVEIAQLPKFCWGPLGSPVAKGPEFGIPPGCGAGMNHYCPGLVWLLRAERTTNRAKRGEYLGKASSNIGYTENWMKAHPKCGLRPHLEESKAAIKKLRTAQAATVPSR